MEQPEPREPAPGRDGGRRLRSGLLAAGAAFGMTLAGLGVAGAQVGDSTGESTSTAAAQSTGPDQQSRDGVRRPRLARLGAQLNVAAEAIGIPVPELLTALRDGQSIARVAQSRNVDVQKVIDAMVTHAEEHLAFHVQAGDLTQAQADERAATLTARITGLVNRTGLPGFRDSGRHGRGHKAGLGVAARAIGISESELLEARRDGRSIAQVARSRNVDVQKVIDALVADAQARLAERVRAGDLTQAQADEKSAALAARVTEMVDRTGFGPGPGGHRGRGMAPPPDAPPGTD